MTDYDGFKKEFKIVCQVLRPLQGASKNRGSCLPTEVTS